MESKNQVEIKRLLGELEACHTVTLDCDKTIAQLKRELTEPRTPLKRRWPCTLMRASRSRANSLIACTSSCRSVSKPRKGF